MIDFTQLTINDSLAIVMVGWFAFRLEKYMAKLTEVMEAHTDALKEMKRVVSIVHNVNGKH